MKNKVTPQAVQDEILAVQYHHFAGTTLVTACITLKNGFTVTGESACADPWIFNKETGRKLAYKEAEQKIWSLLAFRIRDNVTAGRITFPETEPDLEDVMYIVVAPRMSSWRPHLGDW